MCHRKAASEIRFDIQKIDRFFGMLQESSGQVPDERT